MTGIHWAGSDCGHVCLGGAHVELDFVLARLDLALEFHVFRGEIRLDVEAGRLLNEVSLDAVELELQGLGARVLDAKVLRLPVHRRFLALVYVDLDFVDGNFGGEVELRLFGERKLRHGTLFLLPAGVAVDVRLEGAESELYAAGVPENGNVEVKLAHGEGGSAGLYGEGVPGMGEGAAEFIAVGGDFDFAEGMRARKERYEHNTSKPGAQGKNAYNHRHDRGGYRKCRSRVLQRT